MSPLCVGDCICVYKRTYVYLHCVIMLVVNVAVPLYLCCVVSEFPFSKVNVYGELKCRYSAFCSFHFDLRLTCWIVSGTIFKFFVNYRDELVSSGRQIANDMLL